MSAYLVELHGVTAHFRDTRFNTGGINIPLCSYRTPPPSTIFGLLCAAKGGWINPDSLKVGWSMKFSDISQEFQRCQIPNGYNSRNGYQSVKDSPIVREFLSFPILSLIILEGFDIKYFRNHANPLALGRSEDLVIGYNIKQVEIKKVDSGHIKNQFLPAGVGYGALCSGALYFDENRVPYQSQLMVEARELQQVKSENLVSIEGKNEAFYIWDYGKTVS